MKIISIPNKYKISKALNIQKNINTTKGDDFVAKTNDKQKSSINLPSEILELDALQDTIEQIHNSSASNSAVRHELDELKEYLKTHENKKTKKKHQTNISSHLIAYTPPKPTTEVLFSNRKVHSITLPPITHPTSKMTNHRRVPNELFMNLQRRYYSAKSQKPRNLSFHQHLSLDNNFFLMFV